MMRRVDSVPSLRNREDFQRLKGRVQLLWTRAGRKENNEDGCVGRNKHTRRDHAGKRQAAWKGEGGST